MAEDRTKIIAKSSAVEIGTELNQTYKIDRLIGVGGMGEVFKGHNIQTGDPVAIKVVLPEYARDEMIFDLFRKEARVLNHLNHDAIVRYYVFSLDRIIGRPYLAMEFVDGLSLAAQIKEQPLPPEKFFGLLRRLADGLYQAHEAGVIHRDISPDNVILTDGKVERAKIIDFGIARTANVGGGTLLGGGFAGKYNYVSPEQLGLYGGEVTPKSDIYSLGLMMAAALRGRPIDLSGSQVEIIEKRRVIPDLVSNGIPRQFHAVLSAMLQPDPANRPQNMAAVRDGDWEGTSRTGKSRRTTTHPAAQKSSERRLGLIGITLGAAAVLAIGGYGAMAFMYGDWPFQPTAQSGVAQVDDQPKAANLGQVANSQSDGRPPIESNTALGPTKDNERLPQRGDVVSVPPLPVETKAIEKVQLENKPIETKPTETVPIETKPVETKPAETKPAETQPVETKPGETKPAETQLVEAKPIEIKPAEPKPAETKPVETKPAETKPTEPPKLPDNAETRVALLPNIAKINPKVEPLALLDLVSMRNFAHSFGEASCLRANVDVFTTKSAQVSALGDEVSLGKFEAAFAQKAGFKPQVQFEALAQAQCGFVSALNKIKQNDKAPLDIKLSRNAIRGNNADSGQAGDPLKVTIDGVADRNVYLFVVDHEGGIQNINRACPSCISVKNGVLSANLSLFSPTNVAPADVLPFYPMLVFAAAATKPLHGINGQDAFETADFIGPLLTDSSGADDFAMQLAYLKLKPQ